MSPLKVPQVTSAVNVRAVLKQGTRTLRAARAWLEQQAPCNLNKSQIPFKPSISAVKSTSVPVATAKSVKIANKSPTRNNTQRVHTDTSKKKRSSQSRKREDTKQNTLVAEHNKLRGSLRQHQQQSLGTTSLSEHVNHNVTKKVVFKNYKRQECEIISDSSSTSLPNSNSPNKMWQTELPSTRESASVTKMNNCDSKSDPQATHTTHTGSAVQLLNDVVFVTSMQSSEVLPKLCKQTLQPLTIKRALVCQPGPTVKISPQPLQLRETNVCLTKLQAEERLTPVNIEQVSKKSEVKESAVQTSLEIINFSSLNVDNYDKNEKQLDLNPVLESHVTIKERNPNFTSSETSIKQSATQTSPEEISIDRLHLKHSNSNVSILQAILGAKVTSEMATQTSKDLATSNLYTKHSAVQVDIMNVNPVTSTCKETATISSPVSETSVAIQTEQLSTCDAATEVPTSLIDIAVLESSYKKLNEDNEIGPHGDSGVSNSLDILDSLTNFSKNHEKIIDITLLNEDNSATKDKVQEIFVVNKSLSSRILSPILEQTSTSDNSPSNASPLAIPAVSLTLPSLLEPDDPLDDNIIPYVSQDVIKSQEKELKVSELQENQENQDISQNIKEPNSMYHQSESMLPLLSLSTRSTRVTGTYNQSLIVSEHEASSTLSSLADSELSSLDTTTSPSLTMVESTLLRSEGEVIIHRNKVMEIDDTTASDDSSSAASSAPISQPDWSKESGSFGLRDRSVGETGTIPAGQRQRVLYLASRVAPSLLASSASSRSDGELSEGQVMPWSSSISLKSQQDQDK